ncbi:hypothetical protein [Panacagrimonas sp.]|uniref:hypothetical protein n=1 Tax=Panacagrimonas sp. TaxID=2480088 RepID=UPI003B5290AC
MAQSLLSICRALAKGCTAMIAVCQELRLATGSFKATRAYQYPRLSSDIADVSSEAQALDARHRPLGETIRRTP